MNELGNQYARAALRLRRSEIACEITTHENRIRQLREQITHVDGVLHMMDPNYDPASIKPKRQPCHVKPFGKGKLQAHVLGALRTADRPLASSEVRNAIIASLGMDAGAANGMVGRIRACLLRRATTKGLVVRDGERGAARWRLSL